MSLNENVVNVSTNITGSSPRSGTDLVPVIIIHIIIIIGIIGNSFVVIIVAMINSMKTTTNLLLVNVAIADIIMLMLTAIHMILSRTIPFDNSFLCKVIDANTLSNIALMATSLTLTVLSVERYHALVKPMKISRRLTLENVLFVIVGVWIVSAVMNLPIFIYIDFDPNQRRCSPGNNNGSLLVSVGGIVLTMTIIPFIVIAFCYTKIVAELYFSKTICKPHGNPGLIQEDLLAKKKLVKLLITITVVFFIAFVPYGVLQISIFGLTGARKYNQDMVNLARVMIYLLPVHSSINPFLYSLQSNNYRQGFKILIKKLICSRNQDWNISIHRASSAHRTMAAVSLRHDEAEV
ncbi:type-1 angiotensin II receptor B [Exaiptasia diaphana]|uniref:G-protein coupled receptors family 1 profile domain-containing protein n=1 Tax=Exaiptasia diaphana TaxID=2652724 RepID=A0A913YWG4_EXADI|nr:type-1 angiotensin II receptor B [Exaiptasia diaphana]XP_028519402.1 type-1 angiotensin II receptor B [Exaiptasia diaphana]XP_028519403.1 type-1 angiotensin II receptor B [Exaiptasia diaphana]XP_028519406.1 type-1 angiotensin II receptor B [Exaiptasia diaphana]XP_028519411.1 type-1 angiotensin II receptor B [Exaiptasia diaphana]XP_028519415.1 type-1 angiotensin II receptor B [Exaiptasia diaphana]XP_028519416.1 type-1 angiotensin II receptor B [Exaiptasia diaphana]